MNGTISAKQQSDLGDARKIATPQLLRKGLTVYLRNGKHEPLYVVRDPASELHWEFETRQFFVLEMLQVDEEFDALAASYERRFSKPFSRDDLQALLVNLVDQRLLGLAAASHPLIEPYRERLQADLQRLLEEKVAKFRDKTQAPGASHAAKAAVAAPAPAARAGASNDGKGGRCRQAAGRCARLRRHG
ncbi:hypothetical protein LRS11_21495 [Pseudomonas sp. J452]|uniref:hypothetical protein n=1 Tax=Pseudomonas sp. J452 TaxID=2898441 RepID=UPI0021ADCCC0|nr:hypothetical protein [Pseudomonas sp. J452]UUY08335.1 hypothetical protein LRS11_21495 [Pseudomonas sp. J452]